MAETALAPKARGRNRGPRNDYQKQLADLKTYVEVTREAVSAYVPDGESKTGQLLALDAVINRMNAK